MTAKDSLPFVHTARRPLFVVAAMTFVAFIASGVARNGPKPVLNPAVGDGGVSAFYAWEKDVPSKPGRLLRSEPLPQDLMLANASKGVRVLYTSTNGIDGRTPIAVSGSIYVPKGRVPKGGWPIVAWTHGTTGVADVCAPSWSSPSPRDADYLNAWLAEGYAVVATDYQGLGTPGPHPWLTTRPEAWSVLDILRTALAMFPDFANAVVIVGQSQGAHAAVSAALLAKTHAPRLKVKGTVATGVPGGPPFLPETALPARRASVAPSLVALSLYTYMALDPAFNPSEYVTDAGKPVVEAARTGCVQDILRAVERSQISAGNFLKKSTDDLTAKAAVYVQYPTPRFAQPLFVGTGLADAVVLPEDQYRLVRAACDAGSVVEAHYYQGKDHGGAVNASLVDSVPFVRKILAGQHIEGNCPTFKPPSAQNHEGP